MVMITRRYSLILTNIFLLISVASDSYAQMAVMDAQAATQRAQNATQNNLNFVRQISQTAAVANNTAQSIKHLSQQYEAITGNLSLNNALQEAFSLYLSQQENLRIALPSKRVNNSMLDNKKSADVGRLLLEVFSQKDDRRRSAYAPIIRKYRNDSLESALQISEVVINSATESINRVNNAASIADSNQTLKEALDANNHLLVQIAMSLEQATQLLAHLVRTQAAANFEGSHASAEKMEKTYSEQVRDSLSNPETHPFRDAADKIPFKKKGKKSLADKIFRRGE